MPRGDVLWRRLEAARPMELQRLCEIVNVVDYREKSPPVLVEELSKEIRRTAGHTLPNLFRDAHDFAYKQMLIDVADKMAPGWTFVSWTSYTLNDRHNEIEIEETIWGYFETQMEAKIRNLPEEAREQLRKDTENELRNLGYSQILVTQISAALAAGATVGFVAPALAYTIALNTASGLAWLNLWWAGHASAAAVFGVGGGVFALFYAPALVWWLGNTAYRKTVPTALYLIQIRKLREIEAKLG
jgi:uncharacterized protein YaaW (UPF0174 family)